MNGPVDNTEQRVEAFFAHQRERIHAPSGLADRVDSALDETRTSTVRRRWPAIAVTAGAAAAIAAVLLYVLGDFGGGPGQRSAEDVLAGAIDVLGDPSSIGLNSYSGTAEVVRPGFQVEIGDDVVQQLPEIRVVTRFWFEAPDGYRIETEFTSEDGRVKRKEFIKDGDSFWRYDSEENTYSHVGVEEVVSDVTSMGLLIPGALVRSNDIDDLLSLSAQDETATTTLEGEETLLGRPVYVVQVTPNGTERTLSDGSTESTLPVRLWIDKEFLFIMRFEVSESVGAGFGGLEMTVTGIELNGDIPDDLFEFAPPSGAREVSPEEGSFDEVGGDEAEEETEPIAVATPLSP